jgi:hypothetical protein
MMNTITPGMDEENTNPTFNHLKQHLPASTITTSASEAVATVAVTSSSSSTKMAPSNTEREPPRSTAATTTTTTLSSQRPRMDDDYDFDDDDDELDRLADDLVLHEGNGKITRPIKPIRSSTSNTFTNNTNNGSSLYSTIRGDTHENHNDHNTHHIPPVTSTISPPPAPLKRLNSPEKLQLMMKLRSADLPQQGSSSSASTFSHSSTVPQQQIQEQQQQQQDGNIESRRRRMSETDEIVDRIRQNSFLTSRDNDNNIHDGNDTTTATAAGRHGRRRGRQNDYRKSTNVVEGNSNNNDFVSSEEEDDFDDDDDFDDTDFDDEGEGPTPRHQKNMSNGRIFRSGHRRSRSTRNRKSNMKKQQNNDGGPSQGGDGTTTTATATMSGVQLTSEDIEICRRLDDEYERALEEREIGYNARYASVRQSAFLSVLFLAAYMSQGTLVYMHQTDWSIPDALFFSIFTITTVGYGKADLPETPAFQAYTICYIMVGIAALTIMVAQVYQCIALEATRAQHSRDRHAMKLKEVELLRGNMSPNNGGSVHSGGSSSFRRNNGGGNSTTRRHDSSGSDDGGNVGVGQHEIISEDITNLPTIVELFFRCMDRAKHFLHETELGRGVSVIFPFAGLILIGALVVGPLEGWTFTEALYFSVVSLTTVGFGDYVPTERPSIWFCIFWLPFSIGFMSMYLGNVAAFYIRLSDRNIRRIERHLRRRLQKAKEKADQERAEVLRRAYRGQEDEIEAALYGSSNNNKVPNQQHPTSRTILQNPDSDGGLSTHRNADIPLHHARSIAQRQKNSNGFNMIPTSDNNNNNGGRNDGSEDGEEQEIQLFGGERALSDTGNRRRQRIIENCRVVSRGGVNNYHNSSNNAPATAATDMPLSSSGTMTSNTAANNSNDGDRTMKSMGDVIRAVRNTMTSDDALMSGGSGSNSSTGGGNISSTAPSTSVIMGENSSTTATPASSSSTTTTTTTQQFMSIRSTQNITSHTMLGSIQSRKPSFGLRVLVQERFAEIIATEVAGYQSSIDIKNYTLSVTIESMEETADKWSIPRRARKAFRSVAFEVLYFVGEHGLITRGVDALYELTPFEFHGLFSSLVAAMGDADTMEGWLASTDTLALVDLHRSYDDFEFDLSLTGSSSHDII